MNAYLALRLALANGEGLTYPIDEIRHGGGCG